VRKPTALTDNSPLPTADTGPLVLGMDLGDRRSEVCVIELARARIRGRLSLDTTPTAVETRLAPFRGSTIVMEAGTHSPWVSRLLAQLGLKVIVANPNQLALISKSRRKTDRTDAEMLARLGRADLSLLKPVVHRSESRQAHLELLKARDTIVRARTIQINHVRGALKSFGARVPACDASSFSRKALDYVPASLGSSIRPMLTAIGLLTRTIRRYDKEVERLGEQLYPETARLRKVNGVGPLTALAFVLVLGDAHRFRKSRQVGPYLGLCPNVAQSGESNPQLHISKAGNGFLRKLLVQAAHYITGPFAEDSTLRRVGLRLMESGGARGKKRAVVAVARRLAVILHQLWKTGERYDCFRNALPSAPLPALQIP
jgi:transposase